MLTPRQAETMRFIERHYAENGYCPSYQEIATHLDLAAKSAAHRLLHRLADRGLIRLGKNRRRGIEIVKPQSHLNPEYRRGWRDAIAAVRELGLEEAEKRSGQSREASDSECIAGP